MWLVARHHTSYSPDVPAEVTTARDRTFESLAWRWRTRLIWAVDRLLEMNSAAPAHEHQQVALGRQLADEQIVLAELAIGLFHEDHGRLPDTLLELVPDYLPEVPRDLHGSGPLIYRVTDTGYVLYSVSHDGRDDGGAFGTRIQSMGAGYDLDIGTIAK